MEKTHTKHKYHWPWVLAALVIVGLGVGGSFVFWGPGEGRKVTHQMPPLQIQAAAVRKGDLNVYIRALGTVVPLQTVTVTARVQGQISKIQYNEGQLVNRGDLLLQIDSRPYRAALLQSEGQLARDKATLRAAQLTLKRYHPAYQRQAISRQQLDDQVQLVKQYEGSVRADEGNLELARINLDYCQIKSPIQGRVGLQLVDLGNIVQAGSTTPLVVIAQLKPIALIFSVPQPDLAEVQKNYHPNVAMRVDALDRSGVTAIASGRFLTFDNQVDPTTGTVRLKAIFENSNNELFPNEFVNARLLAEQKKGVTLIPSIALQHGSQGSFVYIVAQGSKIQMRNVQVDESESGQSEILSGLNVDEVVATSDFDKLQEGLPVRVKAEPIP
jgi:multidrug efflux system membrane fusion protein